MFSEVRRLKHPLPLAKQSPLLFPADSSETFHIGDFEVRQQ